MADDQDRVSNLLFGHRCAHRDPVPLPQAVPAAGGCRMPGDEDGVASHGRLLAVVVRLGWSQPLPQELVRVQGEGPRDFLNV